MLPEIIGRPLFAFDTRAEVLVGDSEHHPGPLSFTKDIENNAQRPPEVIPSGLEAGQTQQAVENEAAADS